MATPQDGAQLPVLRPDVNPTQSSLPFVGRGFFAGRQAAFRLVVRSKQLFEAGAQFRIRTTFGHKES